MLKRIVEVCWSQYFVEGRSRAPLDGPTCGASARYNDRPGHLPPRLRTLRGMSEAARSDHTPSCRLQPRSTPEELRDSTHSLPEDASKGRVSGGIPRRSLPR